MTSEILPDVWELASLFCKLFLYFGAASLIGGSLCLWQFSDGSRRAIHQNLVYILLGSFAGFQAVLCSFFVQVGQISGAGFAGMFDWGMAAILLDTSLGEVTFYRLGAFVWAMLATLLYLRKLKFAVQPFNQHEYRRLLLTYTLPLLVVALTFRISGHVSTLIWSAQIAIVMHFMAFSIWIGSLYPLLQFSRVSDYYLLQQGMKRFGNMAAAIVLILVVAGVVMVLQLINTWQELLATAYGLGLLTKLLLVLLLLGIAALNKLYLVPRLCEQEGAIALGRSIRIEMLVATLVLAVTAWFSTLIGPVEP